MILTFEHVSWVNKLFKSFFCNPSFEVWPAILDISVAFGKIWQSELFTIKSEEISGNLIIIPKYLTNHVQKVISNNQTSNLEPVTCFPGFSLWPKSFPDTYK